MVSDTLIITDLDFFLSGPRDCTDVGADGKKQVAYTRYLPMGDEYLFTVI